MRILRISVMIAALGCLLTAAAAQSNRRITVTGRLTREGVECQAFRSKNGILYTLTGNLRGFKAGDRVRVVGRVAQMSTCMQGTTLSV